MIPGMAQTSYLMAGGWGVNIRKVFACAENDSPGGTKGFLQILPERFQSVLTLCWLVWAARSTKSISILHLIQSAYILDFYPILLQSIGTVSKWRVTVIVPKRVDSPENRDRFD